MRKDVLDLEMKMHNMMVKHSNPIPDLVPFKNDDASCRKDHSAKKSDAVTKMSLSEFGQSFHVSDRDVLNDSQRQSILSSKPLKSMKSNYLINSQMNTTDAKKHSLKAPTKLTNDKFVKVDLKRRTNMI